MAAKNARMSTRPTADAETLAYRVVEYLPQEHVAELLKCSPSSVSRWVRGESTPSKASREHLEVILEICETVHDPATPWVARVWFRAMNPIFSYDTPKNRFIAGEISSVVGAANEFRVTTAKLKRKGEHRSSNG